MVKTRTSLDATQLNASNQTPYLDIESETEKDTKALILKGKAVVIIDPVTGRALGASDFLSKTSATFQHQTDATLSQANPVSTTLYNVLPLTNNVRLISISTEVTWGVTQPTPLDVVITIDGVSVIFTKTNPVSANGYECAFISPEASTQVMSSGGGYSGARAFLMEGRSVQVDVRITWAVTQPTPLVCRVKWAKR